VQGNVYHLISRFVAKAWFIDSAEERRMYLSLLGSAIRETDWRLFCYAVMSSHVHLGVLAGTTTLRSWLRPMHTAFASWMNLRRERIGAVFVRGPKVIDVRPDGVAHLINYVHYNPVRAGVVAHPDESDWTSQRAYLGVARRPAWLDVACGLELCAFASRDEFAAWSNAGVALNDPVVGLSLSPKHGRGRPRSSPATGPLT
jgi:hypothetical protein